MRPFPPRPPLFVPDPVATGGHDQCLLAWAHRTGRLPAGVGIHHLEVLHDAGCARLARRGACD